MMEGVKKLMASTKENYRGLSPSQERMWGGYSKSHKLELLVRKEDRSDQEVKIVTREPLSYGDLFKVKAGRKPVRKILVEGDSGIGKTTLCASLSRAWAYDQLFQEFDLLLLLPLRYKKVTSAASLSELLKLLHPDPDTCESVTSLIEEGKGGMILIIADGWDELDSEWREGSFFHELLWGEFPMISTLVTSRPSTLHKLPLFDRHVKICGFSEETAMEYINFEFSDDHKRGDSLLEHMSHDVMIKSLCSIPLNCAIMAYLWRISDDSEALPTTMTELYTKFILALVQRKTKVQESSTISSFSALPQSFKLLCEFAFHSIECSKTTFSQEELVNFFPQHFHKDVPTFGLLDCSDNIMMSQIESDTDSLYSFLHLTIQEYLAAIHISNLRLQQPPRSLFSVLRSCNRSYHHTNVWRFCFGMQTIEANDVRQIFHIINEVGSFNFQWFACHCNLDAENNSVIGQYLNEAKCLISYPITCHDCIAVICAITHIEECHDMAINFNKCGNRLLVEKFVDILCSKNGRLQIRKLDLSHNKLGDKCVTDLFFRGLVSVQPVQQLYLADNLIGAESIKSIMEISHHLTCLDLSHNPLHKSGVRSLIDAIRTDKVLYLESLILQGSLTDDEQDNGTLVDNLVEALSLHCHQLSTLDLSENNLGMPGALAINDNHSFNADIALLLNNTKLYDSGVFHLIEGQTKHFHQLELNSNGICSRGATHLADCICSDILLCSKLSLIDNPLNLQGAMAVSRVICSSQCQLLALSLAGCQLTNTEGSPDASITILKQDDPVLQSNTITWLDLGFNNFTGVGIHILADFMHLCPCLQHLSSNSCEINSDDFKQLLDRLASVGMQYAQLQSWDLTNNRIDDSALSALCSHLASLFSSISYGGIALHNNPVSVSAIKRLKDELEKCRKFQQMKLVTEDDKTMQVKTFFIGSRISEEEIYHVYDVNLLNFQNCNKFYSLCKCQDLVFALNVGSSQIVVVEGCTGAGKSSLTQYLIERGEFSIFQPILYFQLDTKLFQKIQTLKDIAEELKTTESQLYDNIEDAKSHALIIIDGFHNLVKSENWRSSIFTKILLRETFHLSTVLILSRPSGLQYLRNHTHIDEHFLLKGFPVANPRNTLSPLKFQEPWIVALCEQHPVILELCDIPLISQLVCQFFSNENGSNTLTDMLTYVINEIIKRETKQNDHGRRSKLQILDLPEDLHSDFKNVCKLAFETLVSRSVLTNSDEVNRFLSAFHLNNSFAINESECFGLVEVVSGGQIVFLHPIIQEYLAGYYLHTQPPLDQLVMIHQYISQLLCQCDTLGYLLPFYFGLIWRKNSEFDINPTKLMFHTLIEFLASCFEVEECNKSTHNITFILCIAETGDNDLWKKLVTKLGCDLCLWLSSEDIKRHKWTIATMISYSRIQEWNINASNFSISDELELYIGARLNKIEVPSMDRSVITLSPRIGIEAASKKQTEAEMFAQYPDKMAAMMDHFQCRAVREILQRAFGMFAEKIRLKGDSSNPAYVSFLSCGCFQDNLENNLGFSPFLPFHFLQVTSKKTLKKLQEEHGVHLAAKHDGKAVELVILLKPCMRRITFSYKSREHCVVIMSEKLAQNPIGKGTIACMVADIKSTTTEPLATCSDESFSSSKSEMVRPNLPLPSKMEENTRTTTVLPQVVTADASHIPTSHSIMHGVPQQEEEAQAQQQLLQRESPYDNVENANGTSIGSGSPRMHHFPPPVPGHRVHLTTSPTPTQQTVHSRSNIKPGAVLFTSVPREIPADLIHPLPDETHQLRRGGNGQIFRGTIGGMNVVYKKTNYRSREYSIIVKLNHQNVVRLFAFMYGEENPAHKRRHYCYHIMPQLSGDCARMLTDKRELTIKELQKKHGNNIRKMGIVRGNLKFLLKEVLHGIRYLHSLHIVHRDIKGSNILLKFHCACTNPLECGCDTKYQVQLCDFDAAVELDENERLPHTSIGSKTSSQPSGLQYVCVPVGTNGFRSPECSMLVVSNSPDCFSPMITTRCDIWSLGILTIRMLIGVSGPSTQREMALLLLYYHRLRYMHEGLHKGGYLVIDKIVTDKLLNVPLLIKDVGWLKGAVRFVECCVAVDPLTRYSAEALLQHDFLY